MQELLGREAGISDRSAGRKVVAQRTRALAFSNSKTVCSVHRQGITWLDLDAVEQRYLLAGSADCSAAIYDVLQPAGPEDATAQEGEHGAALHISRSNPDAHRFAITSVAWYPIDTGLFVTASMDGDAKMWDANQGAAACTFSLGHPLNGIAMSPVATSHCLLAVAGADAAIKLCDPATGGHMFSLVGHRASVWAVCWALADEHQLISGSSDGQIRLWDMRTHGCLHALDQQQTQRARPPLARQRRGSVQQAQAEALAQGRARAHDGAVTCLLAAPDGLHWLSSGADSRVRLWDVQQRRNLLVNYQKTFNRANKARQMALAFEADTLFHPSGSVLQCLDLWDGEQLGMLRGHMDTVNACCWNAGQGELYSGGNDCSIVVWAPPEAAGLELGAQAAAGDSGDAWSE